MRKFLLMIVVGLMTAINTQAQKIEVVLLPLLLILFGLGAFIFGDIMRSGDGEGIGNLLKYIGIAIIVIGVPLTLFLTRKKEKLSLYFGSALPLATIGTQERS